MEGRGGHASVSVRLKGAETRCRTFSKSISLMQSCRAFASIISNIYRNIRRERNMHVSFTRQCMCTSAQYVRGPSAQATPNQGRGRTQALLMARFCVLVRSVSMHTRCSEAATTLGREEQIKRDTQN